MLYCFLKFSYLCFYKVTKCNSPSINGQYSNFILFDVEV